MTATLRAQASSPRIQTATDYVEASAEERYAVISQRFRRGCWLSRWLPRHHPTYGWGCRVTGCDASMKPTYTSLLCEEHATRYLPVSQSMSVNEFAAPPNRRPRGCSGGRWFVGRAVKSVVTNAKPNSVANTLTR